VEEKAEVEDLEVSSTKREGRGKNRIRLYAFLGLKKKF